MILRKITGFLAQRPLASPREIAIAIGSSPDAVENMLQTLERKGVVYRHEAAPGCGSSCRQCPQGEMVFYGLVSQKAENTTAVSCQLPD